MNTILEAQGRVEWWLYTVSHGQLLLRRPKNPAHPRRLDILFKDVGEAHVVPYFDNLRVLEVRPGDAGFEIAATGRRKLFRLVGDNAVGHVVAGAVVHAEDDLEYDEPSSLLA
jgi:hypothetical protein